MSSNKNTSYILIALLAVIWGSSFILMKRALLVYTPYQVGAFRMFTAFIFMLPFIVKHFKLVEKSRWKFLLATGLLGNGIPSFLFPIAETRISSALAGMINSLTPIFTLIVGMLWFGMKAGRQRVTGLAIGLFGAVLLVLHQTGGIGIDASNSFALYIVLATICYAFSVNILRYKLSDMDSIRKTGFALMFTGVPMGISLFFGDFYHRTVTVDGAGVSLACILTLGLLGSAFSTILFNKLIHISGALSAASVTYLIPIVAVLWGIWDHETLGVFHLIGLMAILSGVYLVNKQK